MFNNNENEFIPEYLKQYLFSLEAIICIDILQLGKGYGEYELLDVEEVDVVALDAARIPASDVVSTII